MRDIVIFGIQWAWKWTQARLLVNAYANRLSYFASGDVFRALTSSPNAIGDYLTARMATGELISDDVTMALFELYVATVRDEGKRMLLDGFPRTKDQLEMVRSVFANEGREPIGLHLVLEEHIVHERMAERGRADDTDEAIARRIAQYHAQTQPMIEAFGQLYPLVAIDAAQSVDDVHVDIVRALSS